MSDLFLLFYLMSKQTYHRNTIANAYYVITNGKWDHFKEGDFFNAFWAWHDLASFIIALLMFTTFWSLATWILFNQKIYIEVIGMAALLTEATLGVPQLLRNFQRKSTQGMSIPMVLAWLAGDLAKTGYFVATGSPLQFWICAILQISIDIFILGQVFVYRKNTAAGELPYSANNQNTSSSSEGATLD
uniref:PQ loop repeat protein n=1 Tax=Caenorhabditis tropicalis TaxID=1561998 RepID=A0A1I7UL78_9PELO